MNDVIEVRAVGVAHAINALAVLGTFAAGWGHPLAVPLTGLAITASIYASARIWGWTRRHPELLSLPDKEAFLALPPALQDPVWRQLKAMTYWLAVPQTLVFLTLVLLATGGGTPRIWTIFVPAALLPALGAVLMVRVVRAVRRAIAAGTRRVPA